MARFLKFLPRCLLLGLLSWGQLALAQTVVIAKPIADGKGFVAFQISEVLRREGIWDHPLEVGQLIYPNKMAKAHPIMRFGEAVLILFRTPNALTAWEGLNIHNGCVPALQGQSVEDLIKQIESAPAWKPAEKSPDKPEEKATYAVCPICKQKHVRIPSP